MRLRSVRRSDVNALAAWLPEVAAIAGCQTWVSEDQLLRAVGNKNILTNQDASAFVALRIDEPYARSARVELLAVAPEKRRLGTGGRVMLNVERRLRLKVERIYALVPSMTGLALYFWLRLGYRPVIRSAALHGDSHREAQAWMMRVL